MPGTHLGTVSVSDPNASNDPEQISVTLQITTVACDFAPSDCDVDRDDFESFEGCASGPAIPLTSGCEDKDFDIDNDVDQSDFAVFQRCYSGEDNPADPNCAD